MHFEKHENGWGFHKFGKSDNRKRKCGGFNLCTAKGTNTTFKTES